MAKYWLDANVYIEAEKGPYAFDILPAFWILLDQQATLGDVRSPITVHDELQAVDDKLAKWARERAESGLFVFPEETVQQKYSEVADYVRGHYDDANSSAFLEGADGWVIAHAATENATVVTLEQLVPDNSKKPKIPNVCKKFGVKYIDTYRMLRALGAKFT